MLVLKLEILIQNRRSLIADRLLLFYSGARPCYSFISIKKLNSQAILWTSDWNFWSTSDLKFAFRNHSLLVFLKSRCCFKYFYFHYPKFLLFKRSDKWAIIEKTQPKFYRDLEHSINITIVKAVHYQRTVHAMTSLCMWLCSKTINSKSASLRSSVQQFENSMTSYRAL